MASNVADQNKLVIGYPSHAGRVAAGYPSAAQPVVDAYFCSPQPASRFVVAAAVPHRHHLRSEISSILYRMFASVFAVFLIMGVVFFIMWLVLRPCLPQFSVSHATVSPLNSTASDLTVTWELSLLVKNPNTKLNIFYHRLDGSVFYMDDYLLTQTELPPFYQSVGNQTLIHARLAVVGANVGSDVVEAMKEDQKNGSVRFGVRVLTLVHFQSTGWRTRRHLLKVFCSGVKIGYSPSGDPGSLLNPLVKCEVEL